MFTNLKSDSERRFQFRSSTNQWAHCYVAGRFDDYIEDCIIQFNVRVTADSMSEPSLATKSDKSEATKLEQDKLADFEEFLTGKLESEIETLVLRYGNLDSGVVSLVLKMIRDADWAVVAKAICRGISPSDPFESDE